jgi:hypothetical protein
MEVLHESCALEDASGRFGSQWWVTWGTETFSKQQRRRDHGANDRMSDQVRELRGRISPSVGLEPEVAGTDSTT